MIIIMIISKIKTCNVEVVLQEVQEQDPTDSDH